MSRLWRVNAEAWRIYGALCGRLVSTCELRGEFLLKLTDGWSSEAFVDLVKRLDVILDVLDPQKR